MQPSTKSTGVTECETLIHLSMAGFNHRGKVLVFMSFIHVHTCSMEPGRGKLIIASMDFNAKVNTLETDHTLIQAV